MNPVFFPEKNSEKQSSVPLHPRQGENMEEDELNLLSEDDVAKLDLMTVTAEENKGY